MAVLLGVVVALERSVGAPGEPRAPHPPTTPAPPPLSDEQRAQLSRRRAAEVAFLHQSLRFRPTFDRVPADGDDGGPWQVYRGGADQEIEAPEFYRALGRDDLADRYRMRQRLMIGGFAAGTVAFVVAGVLNIRTDDLRACDGMPPGVFDACVHDHMHSAVPTVVAGGIGLAAALFGTYFYRRPHPIDENDAKALADAYNQRLRRQLGLAAQSAPPLVHDLAVTPRLAGRDAGLALGGRF